MLYFLFLLIVAFKPELKTSPKVVQCALCKYNKKVNNLTKLQFGLYSLLIQATEGFTHVISGGRDRKVMMTDLRNTNKASVCICEESAPVLKMAAPPDFSSLWVATSESTINYWVSKSNTFWSLIKGNNRLIQKSESRPTALVVLGKVAFSDFNSKLE